MKTTAILCLGVFVSVSVRAETLEFPLTVKDLDLKEAQACPGGYGSHSQLTLQKPSHLAKTPRLVSQRPLYAEFPLDSARVGAASARRSLPAVFDESKGTGKGYDRMIADLNGNGDLTDDTVITGASSSPRAISSHQTTEFDAVSLPAKRMTGQWQPRFFVQLTVYPNSLVRDLESGGISSYLGYARAFAGSYLEAQIAANGVRQKFGVVDGNCNFQIGEGVELVRIQRSSDESRQRYLSVKDWFLRDADGSGRFERGPLNEEAEPFSPIVYLNGQPFTVALGPELKSIRFTPYGEALGQVQFQEEVARPLVVWERKTNEWVALALTLEDGRGVLPPGTYRLASFALSGKLTATQQMVAACSDVQEKSFTVGAEQTSSLSYGLPLKLELAATKRPVGSTDPDSWSLFGGLFGRPGAGQVVYSLSLTMRGAAGEKYSGFYKTGGRDYQRPSQPAFVARTADGKEVAGGKFEFG